VSQLMTLDIITPERLFLQTKAQSIVVDTPDGQLGILHGHSPAVIALAIGQIRIRRESGEWVTCFNSEGFAEVSRESVRIMAQAVEWPEEIDRNRAEQAQREAREQLRQKQSQREYLATTASLARAMARLRVSSSATLNMD